MKIAIADAIKIEELQAEVAKLQNENDHIRSQFLDCAGHNAKLRAALEEIANDDNIQHIARKALAEQKD